MCASTKRKPDTRLTYLNDCQPSVIQSIFPTEVESRQCTSNRKIGLSAVRSNCCSGSIRKARASNEFLRCANEPFLFDAVHSDIPRSMARYTPMSGSGGCLAVMKKRDGCPNSRRIRITMRRRSQLFPLSLDDSLNSGLRPVCGQWSLSPGTASETLSPASLMEVPFSLIGQRRRRQRNGGGEHKRPGGPRETGGSTPRPP